MEARFKEEIRMPDRLAETLAPGSRIANRKPQGAAGQDAERAAGAMAR